MGWVSECDGTREIGKAMKINVRIVRAGVAGASGLLALGGASGCSAPEDHATAEPLASSASALAARTTPVTAGKTPRRSSIRS